MTFKMLLDTCVWLDLAKDYRDQLVISALEDLVNSNKIELVVPQITIEEFERNKSRVIEEAKRGFQSHLRLVKEAVNRFADDDESRTGTLKALNEVDYKIVIKGEGVNNSVERIEKLMKSASALVTTDIIKQRVTERALAKKAPYHHSKNSVGDAIIIEFYSALVSSNADNEFNCGFITHNTKDFSELNGDRRKPHRDLEELFEQQNSIYWVSMVDAIKAVDPSLLEDLESESNFSQESRRLSEIFEAEHLLFRQVWYNRHWNLRSQIEDGSLKVVPENMYSRTPYRPDQILDSIWRGALESAKKTEDEIGIDNLGPWDDFEWGMINGKLSALRWVLGDDWDILDT